MAEKDKDTETKAETKAAANKAAETETVAAKDVLKDLRDAGVKVRVPKLDRSGKPVFITDGAAKGTYEMVERAPGESDIVKSEVRGDKIIVVTVDGQKVELDA